MKTRIRFFNFRKRFVGSFNITSLKNTGNCLNKSIPKNTASCFAQKTCFNSDPVIKFSLQIYKENIIFDSKAFQVAIYCNTFLLYLWLRTITLDILTSTELHFILQARSTINFEVSSGSLSLFKLFVPMCKIK